MAPNMHLLACAALAGMAMASPAPQLLDFAALEDAPAVPSGPTPLDPATATTVSVLTSVTISGVATASATGTPTTSPNQKKRQAVTTTTTGYTPYYPALATGYTTDPALAASSTTTANQPCVTQPEAGTYCGFINPEDPCAPQPDGYGPVPTPDTASAFLAYPSLHSLAQAAPSTVPSINNTQYNQVFKDLNGAISASSYLGLFVLQTYDVSGCAAKCDGTDLCTAFNIFAERDPSLNPSNNDSTAPTVWGYNCPNPASMTSFKCTLWGSAIDASEATNTGETREQFQIVITASDGYDKTNSTTPPDCTAPVSSSTPVATGASTPVSTPSAASSLTFSSATGTSPVTTSTGSKISSAANSSPTSTKTSSTLKTTTTSSKPATTGWNAPTSQPWPSHPWGPPQSCHGKAINAPKYSMGSRFIPGPYNPQVCSDYALLQNAVNTKAGVAPCEMFNAYYLHKNGAPFGTYCTLFSAHLEPSWATFEGSTSGNGDRYECKQSWTYTLL